MHTSGRIITSRPTHPRPASRRPRGWTTASPSSGTSGRAVSLGLVHLVPGDIQPTREDAMREAVDDPRALATGLAVIHVGADLHPGQG